MTTEQRDLCYDLMITPTPGTPRLSNEDFLARFPSAVEHGRLALSLLEDACQNQNAEDLECAFIVGGAFGFGPEHGDILIRLARADWHFSHEDVVETLDELQTPGALEPLFYLTQWVPEYLDYDDCRALAVKAIWAIGRIVGNDAYNKLKVLSESDNAVLRKNALYQLKMRRN